MKKFTESHEWVELDKELATLGISTHAQKELGEIVYVELPVIGHTVKCGEEVVVLESTKAAVDIYTPVAGEIVEVNSALRENPELINHEAEGGGWLVKIKATDTSELSKLMDENVYSSQYR